jgi:hypothetical protein
MNNFWHPHTFMFIFFVGSMACHGFEEEAVSLLVTIEAMLVSSSVSHAVACSSCGATVLMVC